MYHKTARGAIHVMIDGSTEPGTTISIRIKDATDGGDIWDVYSGPTGKAVNITVTKNQTAKFPIEMAYDGAGNLKLTRATGWYYAYDDTPPPTCWIWC